VLEEERGAAALVDPEVDRRHLQVRIDLLLDADEVPVPLQVTGAFGEAAVAHGAPSESFRSRAGTRSTRGPDPSPPRRRGRPTHAIDSDHTNAITPWIQPRKPNPDGALEAIRAAA